MAVAYQNELPAGRATQWSKTEDLVLATHYEAKGPQWIYERRLLEFDRSPRAITRRAGILGLDVQPEMARESFGKPWSFAEEAIIHEHLAKGLPMTKPPRVPGRTLDAVSAKLQAMAKGKSRSRKMRPWTAQEEAILQSGYVTLGARKCAEKIGRSVASVTNRACDLGLTKPLKSAEQGTRGALLRKRMWQGAA